MLKNINTNIKTAIYNNIRYMNKNNKHHNVSRMTYG